MIRLLKFSRAVALVTSTALFYVQPASAHAAFTWVEEGTPCTPPMDNGACSAICSGWGEPGLICPSGECSSDFFVCVCDCQLAN
jgi:hypothetical protein